MAACQNNHNNIEPCVTAYRLLRHWAVGNLPATELWWTADGCVSDGMDRPAMNELHLIGSHRGDGNCNKRLKELLLPLGFDKLLTPVASGSVSTMIKPSSLFKAMYVRSPQQFAVRLGASSVLLGQFWKGLFSTAEGRELREANSYLTGKRWQDLVHAIPICLHEDAGPFSKSKGCNLLQWYALNGHGGDVETRYYIFSFLKVAGAPADLSAAAWDILLADFDDLAAGFSSEDGEAFAPIDADHRWTLIPLFGPSDLEAQVSWGNTSYNGETQICMKCLADRTDAPHTDHSDTAAWRALRIQTEQHYRLRLSGCHPIQRARFFTRFFSRLDTMHVFDHKGAAAIVLGGTIWALLREPSLGNTIQARLDRFNRELKVFNQGHTFSSKMPPLRYENIVSTTLNDWVVLHGPLVKAANTRHLCPYVMLKATEHFQTGSQWHVVLVGLISTLCEMYDCMYSAGTFLSDAQHEGFSDAVLRFGHFLGHARALAHSRNLLLFQLTPKMHYVQHMPDEAKIINPVKTQCYLSESNIGKVTQVWRGSVNGPWHRVVQHTVALKVLVGWAIDLDL